MKYEIKWSLHMFFFEKRLYPLSLASFKEKDVFWGNFQWSINWPKTSAAKANGRLLKASKLADCIQLWSFTAPQYSVMAKILILQKKLREELVILGFWILGNGKVQDHDWNKKLGYFNRKFTFFSGLVLVACSPILEKFTKLCQWGSPSWLWCISLWITWNMTYIFFHYLSKTPSSRLVEGQKSQTKIIRCSIE